MAELSVTPTGDDTYTVEVDEGTSSSRHVVTASADDLDRLAAGVSGEVLLAAAFRFLLDREPKESIMSRFDITVISRYFPEFRDRIGDYLP